MHGIILSSIIVQLLCLPLMVLVGGQQTIPIYVITGDGTTSCPSDQLREAERENITTDVRNLLSTSFMSDYNIENVCGEGNWQQVINLNMSDPAQQCPSPWLEYTTIRSCGQPADLRARANCVSAFFNTSRRQYSKVCGRAIGYQYASTDGFARFIPQHIGTPDDNYVDGLSLTHGSDPRQHIWTFTTGYYEAMDNIQDSPRYGCPCALSDGSFGTTPPSYVGNNYFCESGNPNGRFALIHYTDPLWDGQGCVNSECCTFNSPPWFSVTLPNPTTDDIELRICADEGYPNEATTIAELEIYIQ